ncbi:nucleotide exchange factor GrpE [Saccharomonospora cyanea]|uniref:Protein GrpE n=1 Tax=Saccharomonospora cyanea NA-134 TaxID=882082 RepID=H5XQC0_9PSEU|nr:nucleotide exchange factor GrpE [Saccharomonospora cyanea]EHR63853.1 molecular chaperone GrpE (heat shock protein) [Saccharomonospora cyanea NA-134]
MTERQSESADEREQEPVVVRDRRKLDPETGELRAQDGAEAVAEEAQEVPAAEADASGPAADTADEATGTVVSEAEKELEKQLQERTADLQRVQAEYANYRRRVERERDAMAESGRATVVGDLLPLLDDLERAEAHGDLTGAFKAVADKLVGVLEKAGLEPFAREGDEFDPTVHEAVQHDTSPDVDGPTVTTVLRRGYRFGDRVLRAALVGVTDHEPAPAATAGGEEAAGTPANGEAPAGDTDENAR